MQELQGLRVNSGKVQYRTQAMTVPGKGCVNSDNPEGKQILEELSAVRFDRRTFYDLAVTIQTLRKQDPDNSLVRKYLDSLTNYANSAIEANEDAPPRELGCEEVPPPPRYFSEDPHHADTLGPFDDGPVFDDDDDSCDKDLTSTTPSVLTNRSMSYPIYPAPAPRKAAQRQLSGDFGDAESAPTSPSSLGLSKITRSSTSSTSPTIHSLDMPGSLTSSKSHLATESAPLNLSWIEKQGDARLARKLADSKITRSSTSPTSPTSPTIYSLDMPGSLMSSTSHLTTESAPLNLSWVEKQAEARLARKLADSKTLRKLNGQLRCISVTTSPVTVERLLLRGADPNASNRKYRSNHVNIDGLQSKEGLYDTDRCPLTNAICARNIECVRILLGYGADPNIDDGYQQSCLFFAAAYGEDEIVDVLLHAKADANKVQGLDSWTKNTAWPSGSPFLNNPKTEAGEIEISCHSPLMTAVSMAMVDWHPRRLVIINHLLAHEADAAEIAHKKCHSGKDHAHVTPLCLAAASIARGGDTKTDGVWPAIQVCKLLIDAGANINSLTTCKETQTLVTPLDRAIMREVPAKELVELLLTMGGSVSLGMGGVKASRQHISRLASGANLVLAADERPGGIEWLMHLLASHRVLGVTMLLQLVAEFSFTADSKARKDHAKPRHYSREELETAIGKLRRCGITSHEEGQVHYVRRKRFFDKNANNWTEGQIDAVTLVREMQLDETKIAREELVKMVEGPLLV